MLKNLIYLGPVIRYCPILCFGFAASKGYDYPRLIAEYFVGRVSPDQSPVLDIGCGTGLVGVSLRKEGWSSELTGVDISQGMLEVAGRKKVYQKLICADLSDTLQLPQSHFGGMISAGTFTHGHLGPEVLFHLFPLLPFSPFPFSPSFFSF